MSCSEVGEILLLDDDTVRNYRNQFLEHGPQSLLTDNNKGTKGYLSENQIAKLEQYLMENTYSDSKGIIKWIENEFDVLYSPSGINALLNRMYFVYKKPVLTPCKANPEKQEEFI